MDENKGITEAQILALPDAWIIVGTHHVNIRALQKELSGKYPRTVKRLADRYEVTPPTIYSIIRRFGLKTKFNSVFRDTAQFEGEKFYKDASTGYYRQTHTPYMLMQQFAYIKYYGAIPENSTIHFLDGDKANVKKDNLVAIRHGVKHDRKLMASQRRNISPCYVVSGDRRVLVKVPDSNEFGFSILDDKETWPGGIGIPKPIVKLKDDSWEVTEAVKKRLGFILEGAREIYEKEGE